MSDQSLPINPELLEILRDPLAVQEKEKYGDDPGRLELVHDCWLVSADTGLKYPIKDGIPVMLIEEGMKWKDTPVDDLPVPPPPLLPESNIPSFAPDTSAGGSNQRMIYIGAALVLAIVAAVLAAVYFSSQSGSSSE